MRKSKGQKNKRQSNKLLLLGVFGLTIVCGITQAIFTPNQSEMTQIENQGINSQLSHLKATTSQLSAKNDTPSDYLSNGDRVIRTKTQYFDNEVQVWLASESACKYVGLGEACINDLMAMAYTETRSFNYRAVGDGNKSWGAFQIHLGYHPDIKPEQATDPYFAAKWTIKRLISKGYLKDREYAIRSHNGNPTQPQTLPYIESVNKYLAM